MQFVTHTMLSLTTYRRSELLNKYDSSSTSNSFTLRDIVYVMRSAFTVV